MSTVSVPTFRYDEWIKADKIVKPANKNVPKVKHRKKIKVTRFGIMDFETQIDNMKQRTDSLFTNDRTKLRGNATDWRGSMKGKASALPQTAALGPNV